ncbi:VWA domain-containing protein [Stenotrophomonas sp. MMGLT7]|uniref:VWA domain-containing protein n=1 Tax=Stenotrophomonas sp. MMGLT7 TaxID=2901227 RepID=UPI001E2A7C77|nr:VWA domain-containing protein [Stenotrophomonas sp. MMGLT7]MCD7099521.1 VWA domain-containing protein [Stenotrophomonas sp. MMGLT7]
MDITFQYPYAALLLLLLPLLWRSAAPGTRRTHLLLRAAVFACIVAALMQPSLLYRSAHASRVFVLDQGQHLSEAGKRKARSVLETLLAQVPRGDEVTLVQLGGTAPDVAVQRRVLLDERHGEASLSQALTQALQAIPLGGDGSVSVISDGLARDRHWGRAIAGLIDRGIPVDTVALDAPARAAFIGDVRAAPVRAGEAVQVAVDIEGQGQGLVLALYRGERQVAVSSPFAAQGRTRLTLGFPAGPAGFAPLRAVLADAGGAVHDRFDTVLAIQDPLPVLYLGSRADAAGHLQRLLGEGFAVEQPPLDRLGADFDFSGYGAVFVDDLPPSRLPAALQRGLAKAVTDDGVGLVYSGGAPAFGGAMEAAMPLAGLLPVQTRQDEQVQIPSVALVIIIDSSGSMVGAPMELAKQVARLAVRRLRPEDRVGVVEFYGARQWSVPIQPARDTADVERAIGRMQAQGGTQLFPAIQEAYFGLKDTDARYKHMLVITDAGVEDENYQRLLRHIAQDRINVSTALVGNGQGEERMAELANWGRGRFYAIADESSMVELDLKQPQARPASGYRQGRFPVRTQAGQAWWQGMQLAGMPALRGYASVTARDDAQTLLTVADGEPLLSSWQYGAGRVSALMTEPLGQGTGGWQQWPGYGQWLARIVAHTARQQPRLELQLQRRFDRLDVQARLSAATAGQMPSLRFVDAEGRPLQDAPAPATLLEERAPGLFVAELDFDPGRDALAELSLGGERLRAADRAGSDTRPPDRLTSALPLAALATLTGGRHGTDASPPPARRHGGWSVLDLGPWLALLALLSYLAELAYRRWPGGPLPQIQDRTR